MCHAPGSYLEHLAHGFTFCNGCARCFTLDADGRVAISADTNKTQQQPVRKTDVNGNPMDGP